MADSDSTAVHYQAAIKAARILEEHGYEAFLIGGAVRDILLGHLPKDFDLVTNAKPEEILALNEIGKSKYKDTAQAFGVTRAVVEVTMDGSAHQSEIEIATYRRDVEAHLGRKATKIEFSHLEDDINRRDLTINALALDPVTNYLIDYVDGLADIENQRVRFIGEPEQRINEDPLRILRAIRLKNQLGFNYEQATQAALQQAIAAGYLEKVAADRLRIELTRMLLYPSRAQAIADLDTLGALAKLLPELLAAKGVAQPPQFHSEGDVYEHTLLALTNLPANPSLQLVWGTLLHDIGKPATRRQASDRIRFNQHSEVGAKLTKDILQRFNFSKKDTEQISWLVHYHLSIDDLPKMRAGHRRQMLGHPAFGDLLALHKADARASLGKAADGTLQADLPDFSEIEKLWEEYKLQQRTKPLSLKSELGIDGHWLAEHYQLKGKRLGEVLDKLNEAYHDGEIRDQAQAEALIKQLLARR